MKVTCYLLALVLLSLVTLLILNGKQQANVKKGIIPSGKALLRRSRWASILAGVGIVPLLITIGDYGARDDFLSAQLAVQRDTSRISFWKGVPVRCFVEGLYPREDLDVLEEDYRSLSDWADSVWIETQKCMMSMAPICNSLSCTPTFKSKIYNPELIHYRESLLEAVGDYNCDIKKYEAAKKQREFYDLISWIVTFILPILFFISMTLQLNVAFWNYCGDCDKRN